MSVFGLLVWLLGVVVVGFAFRAAFQRAEPGDALRQRFASLGNLAGKTQDEIVAAVGPPKSISSLPDGATLLRWQDTGCHVALRFNGDVFECVTHQYLAEQ